jgi:hypothetical protein
LISIFFFNLHYNFGLQNYKILQANHFFTPEPLHRIPSDSDPKSKHLFVMRPPLFSVVSGCSFLLFYRQPKGCPQKELHCHPSRGREFKMEAFDSL